MITLTWIQLALLSSLFLNSSPQTSTGTLAWELATRESVDIPGHITAIRYYRLPTDPGPHVGHIWSPTGQMLVAVQFTNETASGWQQQALTAPLPVSAGSYVVSVNSPAGANYAYLPGFFSSTVTNGHISAPASAGMYGTTGTFPSWGTTPTSYFRDIVFDDTPLGTISLSPTQPAGVTSTSVYATLSGFQPGTYTVTVIIQDPTTGATATSSQPLVLKPPVSENLVQPGDLIYDGAFRLPYGQVGGSTFEYGATALAFNPAHNSLFMVGHPWDQQVAEVAIPDVRSVAGGLPGLAIATVLAPFTDALEGHRLDVGGSDTGAILIGGIMPYDSFMYITAYRYYDGDGNQLLSQFVANVDLGVTGDVRGPYQIGSAAGMVDGYLVLIPHEWRDAMGGPAFAGQCCIPIISRTSFGPAAFSFDPSRIGLDIPLPIAPLVYYTSDNPLADYGGQSILFNASTQLGGAVFPVNTRSVLFFGRQGLGPYCYGEASDCGDTIIVSKGPHNQPYQSQVWAYDAIDLAAVRAGVMQPWQVRPYATWSMSLPFQFAEGSIQGAAYDAATGRIFITALGDMTNPLVHQFHLK